MRRIVWKRVEEYGKFAEILLQWKWRTKLTTVAATQWRNNPKHFDTMKCMMMIMMMMATMNWWNIWNIKMDWLMQKFDCVHFSFRIAIFAFDSYDYIWFCIFFGFFCCCCFCFTIYVSFDGLNYWNGYLNGSRPSRILFVFLSLHPLPLPFPYRNAETATYVRGGTSTNVSFRTILKCHKGNACFKFD